MASASAAAAAAPMAAVSAAAAAARMAAASDRATLHQSLVAHVTRLGGADGGASVANSFKRSSAQWAGVFTDLRSECRAAGLVVQATTATGEWEARTPQYHLARGVPPGMVAAKLPQGAGAGARAVAATPHFR